MAAQKREMEMIVFNRLFVPDPTKLGKKTNAQMEAPKAFAASNARGDLRSVKSRDEVRSLGLTAGKALKAALLGEA